MKIYNRITLAATAAACLLVVPWPDPAPARIQGSCSDCHTMHNSQDDDVMTFDEPAPRENLLRGDCLGCHAMDIGTPTYDLTTDKIPQVHHTGGIDLAAGNFRHITTSGNQNRGHNIIDLNGAETTLLYPPGLTAVSQHTNFWNNHIVSCVSREDTAGCHGLRQRINTLPEGITGAHHNNTDGQLDQATVTGNSYRFLLGVKGYEDPDWELTTGPGDHNEYYGRTTPIQLGCGGAGSGNTNCHSSGGALVPPDGTMSQFCASCHGNFHTLANGDDVGIGPDAVSPFLRHPTDLALPTDGEYAAYISYNPEAPVARTAGVPGGPSSSVTPGTDAVMCLSCHRAHASEYPDMLRWDSTTIIAGQGTGNNDGCFVCHTTKN
ncbi:MAG: cytochrome c3 family protein [Desulfobulbaceae bacterium]|nr:cytochrome c3 family protein [Desulfobulbaceae bacterium]